MTSETLPNVPIHPVYDGYAFIDDVYLFNLVHKVMNEEGMDPTPAGGLNGREFTSNPSCIIVKMIYIIQHVILKVWHWMKLNFLCGYKDSFQNAARKITLADIQNQRQIADEVERQHQEELLYIQESAEVEKVNEAATKIQAWYRGLKVSRPFKELRQAETEVKNAQKELEVCSAASKAQQKIVEDLEESQKVENLRNEEKLAPTTNQKANLKTRIVEAFKSRFKKEKSVTTSIPIEIPKISFKTSPVEEAKDILGIKKQIEAELGDALKKLDAQVVEKKKMFFARVENDQNIITKTIEKHVETSVDHSSGVGEELSSQSDQQVMLNELNKFVHPNVADVWKMLFDKFTEDPVKSWTFDASSGIHTLKLKKSIQMWTPSLDETNTPETTGGSILIFGKNEAKTIKMKIDEVDRKINFIEGFDIYFYYSLFVSNYHQQPVTSWKLLGDGKIRFTIQMCGSQSRDKAMKNFDLNWRQKGEIVKGEPYDILRSHF